MKTMDKNVKIALGVLVVLMLIGAACWVFQQVAGRLFDYADKTGMTFLGFQGKPAGYFIIFCYCAFAYLIGWICMKSLAPRYEPISE